MGKESGGYKREIGYLGLGLPTMKTFLRKLMPLAQRDPDGPTAKTLRCDYPPQA